MPPESEPVYWQGELLWPVALAEAPVIDLSEVRALGTWAYGFFRERPRQAVVGASKALKTELLAAKLPILFYSRLSEVPGYEVEHARGVTNAERDLLWGEEVSGHG